MTRMNIWYIICLLYKQFQYQNRYTLACVRGMGGWLHTFYYSFCFFDWIWCVIPKIRERICLYIRSHCYCYPYLFVFFFRFPCALCDLFAILCAETCECEYYSPFANILKKCYFIIRSVSEWTILSVSVCLSMYLSIICADMKWSTILKSAFEYAWSATIDA